LGWSMNNFSRFNVETALMARAFKDVPVFMIIEFTAKVCAFAGKRPTFAITVKKNKLCGDQKTGGRYRFVDVYIVRFSGNFETSELQNRVRKRQ